MKPFIPQELPISEMRWEPLVHMIGRANRALARYDGVLSAVPNAELLLSPLTTQEAVLSSRIEGTQASLSEVLKFEAGEKPEGLSKELDIQEILNYRRALLDAEAQLETRPFSLTLLRQLHSTLLDSVRGRDKGRGEFRTDQNWIGREGTPIEQAEFVPPIPAVLPEFLEKWQRFYRSEQPDQLAQLAMIHAQFEILHPFRDGNGRIGRIIIPLFLYEKKLLTRPTFYLSEWLEEHRTQYVQHLRELGRSNGAWIRWIEFFLTAVEYQAQRNAERAKEIMAFYKRTKDRIISLTHSQYAVPLLDRLFQRPVFQTADLKCHPPASRPLIAKLVRQLRDSGIITTLRKGSGRTPAVYALSELIDICEGTRAM